jgi:hypothetical protein
MKKPKKRPYIKRSVRVAGRKVPIVALIESIKDYYTMLVHFESRLDKLEKETHQYLHGNYEKALNEMREKIMREKKKRPKRAKP